MSNNLELSFEFFPPRTDAGVETLARTRAQLAAYQPDFFSVTYGAGGSTRDRTLDTVVDISHNSSVNAAPHITSVGATNAELIDLLNTYRDNGINRLVALRGDPPGGMLGYGECKHASDLVGLIRREYGNHFKIAVAAYPEAHPDAHDLVADIDNFGRKMAAGADLAITQYFYNKDAFFNFMDLCERKNIRQPIIPGIMPIGNFANLVKFSRRCGAEIPRWIERTMQAHEQDPESQRQFGIEVVTSLAQALLDSGVSGLHFYTMNQAGLCSQILDNLDMPA